MDVRSLYAAQKYAASMPAMEPQPEAAQPIEKDFAKFANEFSGTLKSAEATATSAMVSDADPHALVEALAQSELAVEAVVAVRDKVGEAYQEILRMPV
jgi:flagellar hook-basal body complex protein FliE